jgi:hypothetical protein
MLIDILSNANNFFYLLKQTPAVFAEEKHIFAAVHLALLSTKLISTVLTQKG